MLGEVRLSELTFLDMREKRVLFAEVNLHDLFPYRKAELTVTPLALYPGMERDWTIAIKAEGSLEKIWEALAKINASLLEKTLLLDLYQNDRIGKDKKNITLRFFYRDPQQTLTAERVELEHRQITHSLVNQLKDLLC
jgi:phenylalanyl-tRNA synthetase beta chain